MRSLVLAVFGALIVSLPICAQSQTRYLATANLGLAPSLGYQSPISGGSFAVERPLGRFEIQGLTGIWITRKLDSGTGHSAAAQGAVYWFATQHAAFGMRAAQNWLWTEPYTKHSVAVVPTFLLQAKMGVPARLYVGYQIPNGCGNCAGIQSNRMHGMEVYWEGQIARFERLALLMGHEFDVVTFKDQAPTGAPPSDWVWHYGYMYEMSLRLRF